MALKDDYIVAKKKTRNSSDEIIENLIYCILNYKIKYNFSNTDFGDESALYKKV